MLLLTHRPLLLEKDVRYLGDRWVAFISALNRSDKYSQEQVCCDFLRAP